MAAGYEWRELPVGEHNMEVISSAGDLKKM